MTDRILAAPKVQRNTFYLLGCERCGRFSPPPPPLETAEWVSPSTEPLRCLECGDTLLLAECWIANETRMWQERPGAMWQHVAFAEDLPKRNGRRVWATA